MRQQATHHVLERRPAGAKPGELGLMRVLLAGVDLEALLEDVAELVFGQHPEDGFAQDLPRLAPVDVGGRPPLQAPGVTAVAVVHFLLPLLPREDHLRRVEHHDEVAVLVAMGLPDRLMLPHKHGRKPRREAPHVLPAGVDHVPLLAPSGGQRQGRGPLERRHKAS